MLFALTLLMGQLLAPPTPAAELTQQEYANLFENTIFERIRERLDGFGDQLRDNAKQRQENFETLMSRVNDNGPLQSMLDKLAAKIEKLFWSLVYIAAGLIGILILAVVAFSLFKSWLMRLLLPAVLILAGSTAAYAEDAIPVPDVVMYTGENCPPCTKWKLEVLPKLVTSGCSVLIVKTSTPPFPRFAIKVQNGWNKFTGFLTFEAICKVIATER